MKNLVFTFCVLVSFFSFGQEVARIVVNGQISAPSESEVEGIVIYNNSSNKGVVTDVNGAFKIAVALNDEIVISAIQYATFTVPVDERTITTKKFGVYLNPVVNKLEEVTVRQYDLTGNLIVDVSNIKTVDFASEFDISFETMEFDYEFTPDKWSSIGGNFAESAFYNGQQQYGANLMGGIGLLASIIFNKKASRSFTLKPRNPEKMVADIRERFSHRELRTTFKIPEGKEDDFLYFLEGNGLTNDLLLEKNELLLFTFLEENAVAYVKQIDE